LNPPQSIGVGLLGLGVVGGGVAQALRRRRVALAKAIGGPIRLVRALVKDPTKPRYLNLFPSVLTTNAARILEDPHIQIVVELMGGEEPAGEYVRRALLQGKHVVTANKDLMSQQGSALLDLADERGLNLRFEGAVGGAIPIVGSLTEDLLGNDISSIHAIINGTTNFILTSMADEGMGAEDALGRAQQLGYAEADPSKDVSGLDAAYKLAILASLAFHTRVDPRQVFRQGIAGLSAKDFRYARELGYAIKLLAIAKAQRSGVEVRVHPALIPEGHLLAKVGGVFNAVEVAGEPMGRAFFHGLGAGADPTTSAVLGDMVHVGRMMVAGGRPLKRVPDDAALPVKEMAEVETRYYFRLNVPDRAGVLSQITRVLGDQDISIASIIQKDADALTGTAEIVITTHPAREAAVQRSLALLEGLDVVKEVSNMIRLEELPV
jgi:homoserine dehydrogenase